MKAIDKLIKKFEKLSDFKKFYAFLSPAAIGVPLYFAADAANYAARNGSSFGDSLAVGGIIGATFGVIANAAVIGAYKALE